MSNDVVVLERLLGRGSCGNVYLGRHKSAKKPVAVKEVVKDDSPRCPRLLQRLETEVDVMSTIKNKHICRLLGHEETNAGCYLIMEYAEGGDLLDYINSHGPLPEKKARRLFKQILLALRALHQAGWVHRDVKPENVFLTKKHKQIKLGDFGFATRWRPDQRLQCCVGTFPYTAPEVLDQRPYLGPEVDVWSAGTVLLAMLTARIPFGAPTKAQSLKLLRIGEFSLTDNVSPRAAALLGQLLHPDPTKRLTVDEALRHSWVNEGFSVSPSVSAVKQLLMGGSEQDSITTKTTKTQSESGCKKSFSAKKQRRTSRKPTAQEEVR